MSESAARRSRFRFWRARNVLPGERFTFSARIRIFGRVYWIEGGR